MLTIYYCDDDSTAIEKAKKVTETYCENSKIPLRFLDFSRAEDLLFYIEDYLYEVDIVFLDIFMDELNGMDTAKKLRNMGYKGEIIFVTSSSDYVFEAFEVDSFNYLLKGDLDETKFLKVLDKAVEKADKKAHEFLHFSMGSDEISIHIDEIHYFEIHRRIVTVMYDIDRSFDFYESMDQLSKDLEDKDFIRVHRAFLVNMNHIVSISKDHILLKGSHQIPVGVTYYEKLLDRFNHFLQRQWDES